MQFNTEIERKQHAIAALIPIDIWENNTLFGRSLAYEVLEFIESFTHTPELALDNVYSSQVRKHNWCLLLFKYQNISPAQLWQWGKQLSNTDEVLFELAIQTKQFLVINYFLEMTPNTAENFFKYCMYCYTLFPIAVRYEALSTINQLLAWIPVQYHALMISLFMEHELCDIALVGSLAVMQCLLSLASNTERAIITQYSTGILIESMCRGNHEAIDHFLNEMSPSKQQAIICAKSYRIFQDAASYGNLHLIKILLNLMPQQQFAMIAADDYTAFCEAATYGHIEVVNHLITLITNMSNVNPDMMIAGHYYQAVREAVKAGHIKVIESIFAAASEKIKQRMFVGDASVYEHVMRSSSTGACAYLIFRLATEYGQIAVMDYLLKLASPEQKLAMIDVGNYQALCLGKKQLSTSAVIAYLYGLAPEKQRVTLQANPYLVLYNAVRKGDLLILERLLTLISVSECIEFIKKENYLLFEQAVQHGQLAIIDRLLAFFPPELHCSIVTSHRYINFRMAAKYGYVLVVERLYALLSAEQQRAAFADEEYAIFSIAAENGCIAMLHCLWALAPIAQRNEMLMASDYKAFRLAAAKGHMAIVRDLLAWLPVAQQSRMIAADNYQAIRNAMRSAQYQAIRNAIRSVQFEIVVFLLGFTDQLNWAEMHDHEFGAYGLHFIVALKVHELRAQQHAFVAQNPNGVFTLHEDQAHYYFYILRNLIRQNRESLLDDVLLLLSIPAIHQLAALGVQPNNEPNELLRVAMDVGNVAAARMLVAIPAVRDLAARNGFYQGARGIRDLREIASDRESSMRALSKVEKSRLAQVHAHYQHKLLNETDYKHHFSALIALLINRYQQNPAIIQRSTQSLVLPLQYDDFNELPLSKEERELALIAYYKNIDHTAWRYLLRPNPWMAENAAFVTREAGIGAWSTFEEYIPLIVLLYLAASDSSMPACDDHSLSSRIEHFIRELALIGRAHNWDQCNAAGKEYDNLKGDAPSCFSGVLRRLFQSVLGHPLLRLLTSDIVDASLREFVHAHFCEQWGRLSAIELEKLKVNYNIYTMTMLEDVVPELCQQLKFFNISSVQIESFLQSMHKQWRDQWTEVDTQRVHYHLAVTEHGLNSCHAHTLGALGFVDLIMREQHHALSI